MSSSNPSMNISEAAVPSAAPAEVEADPRAHGVTFRVVVLCLLLACVFGYALPVIDYKFNNTFLGGSHLPPGAIGAVLLLVLVVNPLLRLLGRKWALGHNEVLTVYITCLFSSLVPGHGSEGFLIPNLVAPFYYATRENAWLDFLQPYLKPWLVPSLNSGNGVVDRMVGDAWYMGLSSGQTIPWGAWLVPMLFWGGFTLLTYFMWACLSVMLRGQWADREALAFPLLRLPLTLTEDLDRDDKYGTLSRFFRNPSMWVGFAIAVAIQILRGTNLYFPDVPTVPLELDMGRLFTDPPWNQLGWVPVNVYPMVIGITYLLTSEISFSLWFFMWFIKFQYVIAYSIGFPNGTLPGAPGVPDKLFTGYQVGGCYLAYVAIVLWTAREHLGHIMRRAVGRTPRRDEERSELLSYPVAFWGFVSSFVLMVVLTCAAGVRVDIALALWVSYLILGIGLTRVAVEGGMLALQHGTQPLAALANMFGQAPSTWLTTANGLVPASLFQSGFAFHMRGFIMPSFVQGFKLAHDRKIAAKPLAALIAAVIIISVVVSWWTIIRMGYHAGALTFGHSWWAKDGARSAVWFVESMTRTSTASPVATWIWTGVGASFTYMLLLARSRFIGFPFHPIGYLMALSYPTYTFWVSIFLGWLAKVLITRFGGNDVYRNAIPLFLGLVLGDVTMMLFWLGIDGWQGRTSHLLLPG